MELVSYLKFFLEASRNRFGQQLLCVCLSVVSAVLPIIEQSSDLSSLSRDYHKTVT